MKELGPTSGKKKKVVKNGDEDVLGKNSQISGRCPDIHLLYKLT